MNLHLLLSFGVFLSALKLKPFSVYLLIHILQYTVSPGRKDCICLLTISTGICLPISTTYVIPQVRFFELLWFLTLNFYMVSDIMQKGGI